MFSSLQQGLNRLLHVKYCYDPLSSPHDIRLVEVQPGASQRSRLRCSLKIVSLDTVPLYTALSYTWGSPFADGNESEISKQFRSGFGLVRFLLNDHSISVTRNLVDALYQFSKLGLSQYFWIDTICINQADVLERNSQVSMMGDIYASADSVLVWLGEEDWSFKVANVFVTKFLPKVEALMKTEAKDRNYSYSLTNPELYKRLGEPEVSQDIWDGLAKFFERKWFSRVWTFQEASLAKEIEVYCGEEMISWDRLCDLLQFLGLSDWDFRLTKFHKADWTQSEQIPGVGLSLLIQQRVRLMSRESIHNTEYRLFLGNISGGVGAMDCLLGHLDQLIYLMRLRNATDPRDHFNGLFGITQRLCDLAEIEIPLPFPDYSKSVAIVFMESFRTLLKKSKSLCLLSSVEDGSQRTRTDLPTWVPDLTASGNKSLPSFGRGDHYAASRKLHKMMFPSEIHKILSIAGYCIDTVAELGDDDNSLANHGAHEPFERTARLFLRLPKGTYHTGQDHVEVMWRTMIADQAGGISPAPQIIGNAFHQHLLMYLSTCSLDMKGYQQGKTEEMRERMAPLVSLSKTSRTAATLIPSMAEIEARRDVYYTLETAKQAKSSAEITDAVREPWHSILREEEKAVPFDQESATTFAARRLFKIDGNLIGLGPRSTQRGDKVYVLPGARVPFILRKRMDGRYGLVGEAYVHGIMHGEALERENLELERLDLL